MTSSVHRIQSICVLFSPPDFYHNSQVINSIETKKILRSLRTILSTKSCEILVCRTMSEIDTCQSHHTIASTVANVYCWSRKTLVTIHWTHLRVNLICIKSFCQQINEQQHAACYGTTSTTTPPHSMFINDITVTSP